MRHSQAAEKRNLQLYSPWTFPPLKMTLLYCIESSGSRLISNAASHPSGKECPATPLESIKIGKAFIQVILSFTIATLTVKITNKQKKKKKKKKRKRFGVKFQKPHKIINWATTT